MVTADTFATQAQSTAYDKITYEQLDCQAFVERVLKDSGVRNARDKPYDWKGSNDMWRNALFWRGTIDECKRMFGCIPLGAWVFIVKRDGGETARGYHDDMGNATHVGIYCRNGEQPVRDSTKSSTRDGVGYRSMASFNYVGLAKCLGYSCTSFDTTNDVKDILHNIEHYLTTAQSMLSELSRLLEG